jgi:hypothetical protein
MTKTTIITAADGDLEISVTSTDYSEWIELSFEESVPEGQIKSYTFEIDRDELKEFIKALQEIIEKE